ncbi:MAG: glycerophosphodiester phosphodiesterase family protein [Rhodospirillaceae bacterium]|jgi:glycerophosphoryl diester phosphodiesterase
MFADRFIAHRGGAAHAPENTLSAVREGAARGAKWIEVDVSVLGDGTPVIFHDETLERTTNGKGKLSEHTWDDVAKLDAGSWFDPTFVGEPVTRLWELLDVVAELDLGLNLELKTHHGEREALVAAVVPELRDAELPPDKLLVSSFDHDALSAFRRAEQDAALALLYWNFAEDWRDTAAALNPISVNLSVKKITNADISAVKAAGLELYSYTVNDLDTADSLFARGIDGVFTDVVF